MTIEEVLRKHQEHLLQIPHVTGVGIGEKGGRPILIVFVSAQVDEAQLRREGRIPKTLDGYDVEVEPEIKIG